MADFSSVTFFRLRAKATDFFLNSCTHFSDSSLTCCDDFDTEADELDDKFCRLVPLPTVVVELSGFFLLKFSSIEAISGDMFCCGLLTIIESGSSDIYKTKKKMFDNQDLKKGIRS